MIDLFLANALTIVTEFIGLSLAFEYLGLPQGLGVLGAAALVMLAVSTGNFRRFERFAAKDRRPPRPPPRTVPFSNRRGSAMTEINESSCNDMPAPAGWTTNSRRYFATAALILPNVKRKSVFACDLWHWKQATRLTPSSGFRSAVNS